jgi:hypothetical protein
MPLCEDSEAQCGAWARSGECKTNPSYMERNCRLACEVCTAGEEYGTEADDTVKLSNGVPVWMAVLGVSAVVVWLVLSLCTLRRSKIGKADEPARVAPTVSWRRQHAPERHLVTIDVYKATAMIIVLSLQSLQLSSVRVA